MKFEGTFKNTTYDNFPAYVGRVESIPVPVTQYKSPESDRIWMKMLFHADLCNRAVADRCKMGPGEADITISTQRAVISGLSMAFNIVTGTHPYMMWHEEAESALRNKQILIPGTRKRRSF